jgi:DNA-binding NtrC family response regulator
MKILIVEDEQSAVEPLVRILQHEGWNDLSIAKEASIGLQKALDADLMITDVRLPDFDGLTLLKEVRKVNPAIEVIVMTGFATVPSAVEAMKHGARAYLTKPFRSEEIIAHVREVQEKLKLKELAAGGGRGALVGTSAAMRRVYAEIDICGPSASPVLITGETGTGKDLAANAIHGSSKRKDHPFVSVNLGALPRELVEGELFGHEKGAFTGAHAKKQGRFVVANGGTLFLDEIDSLPIDLQPKLLRVIEKYEVWPLGSEKHQKVDVRIIAATNSNIEERVKSGAFREDLYYRLNVLRIEMPPLRSHIEDVPQIARALLDRMSTNFRDRQIQITASALSFLVSQPWKGNVRELSNTIERALTRGAASPESSEPGGPIVIDGSSFGVVGESLPPVDMGDLPFKKAKSRAADIWARNTIRSMLTASEGNVSAAARKLKMSRTALIRLIQRYGLK